MSLTLLQGILPALLLTMAVTSYGTDPGEPVPADVNAEVLDQLSLSDLLTMPVTTGSFLELDLMKSPLSMTIISRDMVRSSGARTMSELLEIYVPGFIFNINKWNGTLWGMRGVVNDRNTKIIYLVNGHKMNTQSRDGFQSETVLGLLSDIERVEVLRGPAGLVYGTGAIAGIINVVTRKADDATSSVSVSMDTDRSKSVEANVYGSPAEDQNIAVTAGYRVSEGMPTGKSRIYGRTGWPPMAQGLAGVPADGNLGSTDGNWRIGGNWSFKKFNLYARATRQRENAGAWFVLDPWPEEASNDTSLKLPPRNVEPGVDAKWSDPEWRNTESFGNSRRSYLSDNFMVEGNYEHPIGDNSLQFKLGFDRNSTTMEREKRDRYNDDLQYVHFINETFGESRLQASGMFLLRSVTNLQIASGIEYRLDHCGNDMQGRNFEAMNLKQRAITDIRYNTFSLFAEGFYDITDKLGVEAGGRLDAHTRAFMANPKLAFVARPSEDHSIKLIYQSSSNNGSADNYESNRYHYNADGIRYDAPWLSNYRSEPDSNTKAVQPAPTNEELHKLKPEKVHSVELAYVGNILENVSLKPSVAWGMVKDLFGWSQELFTVLNVGEYQYFNFDFDAGYTGKKVRFGINHTVQRPVFTDPDKNSITKTMYKVKQNADSTWGYKDSVDAFGDSLWTVEFEPKDTSFNILKTTITLDGKDFLNFPTNMTKLYLMYSPFEWVTLGANLRLLWGIPGRKASLTDPAAGDGAMVYNYFGYYGEKEDQGFKDYLMHSVSKKLNANATFFIPGNFAVSIYANNILGMDRHTGDPEKDSYTVNTLRLIQMVGLGDRDLYSMDQQSFGISITKDF
jgi:outer membrane receptor protein involved in Fe transport